MNLAKLSIDYTRKSQLIEQLCTKDIPLDLDCLRLSKSSTKHLCNSNQRFQVPPIHRNLCGFLVCISCNLWHLNRPLPKKEAQSWELGQSPKKVKTSYRILQNLSSRRFSWIFQDLFVVQKIHLDLTKSIKMNLLRCLNFRRKLTLRSLITFS